MHLTDHAQKRLKQRGIPDYFVDLLIDFGHTRKSHNGCEIVFLTHHDKLILAGSHESQNVSPQLGNTYLVLSRNGDVVTVGHRHRRIKHH